MILRIPSELHKQVAGLADKKERSSNYQLVDLVRTGLANQASNDPQQDGKEQQ